MTQVPHNRPRMIVQISAGTAGARIINRHCVHPDDKKLRQLISLSNVHGRVSPELFAVMQCPQCRDRYNELSRR